MIFMSHMVHGFSFCVDLKSSSALQKEEILDFSHFSVSPVLILPLGTLFFSFFSKPFFPTFLFFHLEVTSIFLLMIRSFLTALRLCNARIPRWVVFL